VLVGLGAVEQRYRAVLEVPGKARTGWAGWRIGLRPTFCPHLMPALAEARIVAMRLALVRHGPVAAPTGGLPAVRVADDGACRRWM
jgi:hypothetical protein